MADELFAYVERLAHEAKRASRSLSFASDAERVSAIRQMAQGLREHEAEILASNEADVRSAAAAGTTPGLLDRLLLTPERIESMAQGLERLTEMPDPLGRVLEHRKIDQGVDLQKVTVPLGLVAMVYEPPMRRVSASGPATHAFYAPARWPNQPVCASPASFPMPLRPVACPALPSRSSRFPIARRRMPS